MKKGDREKLRALIIQAVRDWNELNTDIPLTSYIAEWLLVNNLDFTVRCRDCKYLNVVNRPELYAHCRKTNTVFRPFDIDTREHFCACGERKDND